MNNQLTEKNCVPCQGNVPPLSRKQRQELLRQLTDWEIVGSHHLHKTFRFPDFAAALRWVNTIGEIAEAEGHHPDINLTWGKVRVDIWTHEIDNLTENDFVLAAKLDEAEQRSATKH